jgi:hypothetical protein
MARLTTISKADLKGMNKTQLIDLIVDYQKYLQESGSLPTADEIKSSLTPLVKGISDSMEAQFQELQAQISDLKTKINETANSIADDEDDDQNGYTFVGSRRKSRRQFNDVVRQSDTSALNDERHESDVVIGRAPESGDDNIFIASICEKMGFNTKPSTTHRLGKPTAGNSNPRLLKVTFPTSFDARSFMAAFEAKRMDKDLNLPAIRLRSGKSKEELEVFRKSAKLAYNLNAEAKKAGRQHSESFSLRDNGDIWKFATNENGAWKRVTGWSPPPQPRQSTTTSTAPPASPVASALAAPGSSNTPPTPSVN